MNEILNTAHPGKTNQPGRRKQVTTNTCPITGQPLKNPGDTIHPTAWQPLAPLLTHLHQHMQTLDAALGKQLHHNTHTGKHQASTGYLIDLGLLDTVWVVRSTIQQWSSEASQHCRIYVPADPTWQTTEAFWRWAITKNRLTQWPQAPQAIDELTEANRLLARAIDTPPAQTFLGLCPGCATPKYATRHHTPATTTCPKCQTQYQPEQAKQAALQHLGYKWLPAEQAAQAAALLTGKQPPKRATLDTWAHRGQIEARHYRGRTHYQPAQIAALIA